jgi:hypothetical protein
MSSVLDWAVWIPAVVLQLATVALMLRLGLYRKYRAFFCYTAFNVCRSAALYALLKLLADERARYATYFYAYWALDAVSIALCFLVLHSVFRMVLENYPWLQRFASATFAISVVVLLGIAVFTTAFSPGTETQHIIAAILLLERSLMIVQVGIVVLMFVFSAVAALPWRTDLAFGIVLGFGINASIEMAASATRAQFSAAGNHVYQVICRTGYFIAVLIWLQYIRAPKEAPE